MRMKRERQRLRDALLLQTKALFALLYLVDEGLDVAGEGLHGAEVPADSASVGVSVVFSSSSSSSSSVINVSHSSSSSSSSINTPPPRSEAVEAFITCGTRLRR